MRPDSISIQEDATGNQTQMNDDFLLTEYTALRNEILKRLVNRKKQTPLQFYCRWTSHTTQFYEKVAVIRRLSGKGR